MFFRYSEAKVTSAGTWLGEISSSFLISSQAFVDVAEEEEAAVEIMDVRLVRVFGDKDLELGGGLSGSERAGVVEGAADFHDHFALGGREFAGKERFAKCSDALASM